MMTTLEQLTARREVEVETPHGPVKLRTPSFAAVAPLMELAPAEQAPALISICAIEPEITRDAADELDTAVVMALVPACMKLCGLGPPPD